MPDFKLKKNPDTLQYDIVISAGDYEVVSEKEEILQRNVINLSTFRGENFADSEGGTDYYNNIFPYSAEDITLQDEFKSRILGTRDTLSIDNFLVTQSDNTLTVSANLTTENGEIQLDFEAV